MSLVLDFAAPLVFAALGGVLSERAGVVNIGLEGMMRFGAFGAAAGAIASGSPWIGLACGALAGAAAAGVSPPAPALPRDRFGHSALSYAALAVPLLLHLWLSRTPAGLRVRAVGEHPHAAATLGVRVLSLRAVCVLGSGVLAGIGGATLSVGILGQFDARMPAGQGFMALAAVVFGKWTPLGAAGAAFFFAAADALQRHLSLTLHATDLRLDGVFLALPYALTLLVLALGIGRTSAPAADGVPYDPEART